MERKNILLTGASGFIGRNIMQSIISRTDMSLSVTSRNPTFKSNQCQVYYGSMDVKTNWTQALQGKNAIIHTAASAKGVSSYNAKALATYRSVNVDGTLSLASQAAKAGVNRFVFISSIKVNGNVTDKTFSFKSNDLPRPQDLYGSTKLEIERGLQKIAQESGMELVIIRTPLVYGPGVKGNFMLLANLVSKGVPLPFKLVQNSRSFIATDNLIDLVIICIEHPDAANQTFLAADNQDMSTPELLRTIANTINRPVRLFSVPPPLLYFGSKVIGKGQIGESLLKSLRVDISNTVRIVGWRPRISVSEGLERCFSNVKA
jgi:nucleoside-diphosphate-sugar epimerase